MKENLLAIRPNECDMILNRLERVSHTKTEKKKAPPLPRKEKKKQEFTTNEVLVFNFDPSKKFQHRIEHYSGKSQQIMIDEEFLLEDGADPEKVLEEMKRKQMRLNQMENEEKKLSDNIKLANKDNKETKEKKNEESEAFKKIKDYLKKSPASDRLDFTQNLLKMAHELGKDLTISGILPSFSTLSRDNDSIKMALVDQILPIASFTIESHECEEYDNCVRVMVPILNEFLYDKSDKVKRKSVKALIDFCDLLTPDDRGNYILKFMLELAHTEDDEKARVTALKILNQVAGKLDSELCEKFIVKEIKSLAIDPFPLVRKNVAANLSNVCRMINRECFLNEIFPLLTALGKDKEDEVRNSCVEQVPTISGVCPPAIRTGELEKLYLNFMTDSNKKVRVNAFKHLGKFLDTLKDLQIDQDFLELYIETGMRTKAKDLQYYCAYNIPGMLYILKKDSWESLEELYMKLSKSHDVRVKKTLSHSIHEIAKIVGSELTESILIDILNNYLRDPMKEVRVGIIKNLHEFCNVISEEQRFQFLRIFKVASEEHSMTETVAQNIGDFSMLFSEEEVSKSLLPLFFKLCKSRMAHVRKAASLNLAKMLEVYKNNPEKQAQILSDITKKFCKSRLFTERQAYIYMSSGVMNKSPDFFSKFMKSNLCLLAKDRVPNVRIVLSKILSEHIKENGSFYFDKEINKAIYVLQKDRTEDVLQHVGSVMLTVSEDVLLNELKEEEKKEELEEPLKSPKTQKSEEKIVTQKEAEESKKEEDEESVEEEEEEETDEEEDNQEDKIDHGGQEEVDDEEETKEEKIEDKEKVEKVEEEEKEVNEEKEEKEVNEEKDVVEEKEVKKEKEEDEEKEEEGVKEEKVESQEKVENEKEEVEEEEEEEKEKELKVENEEKEEIEKEVENEGKEEIEEKVENEDKEESEEKEENQEKEEIKEGDNDENKEDSKDAEDKKIEEEKSSIKENGTAEQEPSEQAEKAEPSPPTASETPEEEAPVEEPSPEASKEPSKEASEEPSEDPSATSPDSETT